MAADRFSPVAPAHIRVLLLPVGQIERSRFVSFLESLQHHASIVPLDDVKSYIKDDDLLLAPAAFPHGSLLYNYTTSPPNEQQQQLSPFELFREPLLVLGVKDGPGLEQDEDKELRAAAELLREKHPRAVHRQLIVLHDGDTPPASKKHEYIYAQIGEHVPKSALRSVACDFSARFLVELSTYARAMQVSPGVQTPGQTARSLQRTSFQKEPEEPPLLVQSTPPTSPIKSAEEYFRAKSPPPATSFDQMTNASGSSNRTARPERRAANDSTSSPRPSSPEKASMQGFGSATSQEKLKSRGKARVGIVAASIQMLAGQWSGALRMFVEHTSKARVLSDSVWYAKGLEGIVVCLLLHAWAGLDFQIPSICYPIADRSTSAHSQRFSVNIPSDFRVSSDGQPSTMARLATALPELLKYILTLYHSGEGSLELPFVSIAEGTIRFSKLLAILQNTGGTFREDTFEKLMNTGTTAQSSVASASTVASPGDPMKAAVPEMLASIHPLNEENVSMTDQVGILAGISSVYTMVGMNRKAAIPTRDMITKLTGSLISARKRGAAEMGIHPAASLSVENGANAIFSAAEDGGLRQMMSDLAAVYGVPMFEASKTETSGYDIRHLGNDTLKLDIMRALAAFCEAAPYPHGVLRVNASMLRAFGSNAAVDADPSERPPILSKDEQIRCLTAINKTIGVSSALRIPEMEAEYWDDFLVRDVEFLPADPSQAVADLGKLQSGESSGKDAGNPLLYDPNSSRPSTAKSIQPTQILVQNESSTCRVTLQNPHDISVEVESIKLVSDDVELRTNDQPFTLSPLGIQRISLSLSPSSTGSCKVTGCLVKIQGCRKRAFPIISQPWTAALPSLLKEHGTLDGLKEGQKAVGPEPVQVALNVIAPQPLLTLDEHTLRESSLMLLDGEVCEHSLTLRNNSDVTANIFNITTSNDAVQLQEIVIPDDSSETSEPSAHTAVPPGESVSFTFDIMGKRNVNQVQVIFSYSSKSDTTQYARILSVPVTMTVNAALQVARLDALPLDIAENGECSFVLAFDVGNAWPKSLFYSCFVADLKLKSAEPRRCHNHEGVLAPSGIQRVFLPVARSEVLTEADDDPDTVRKVLLERLRIYWEVEGEERTGWVDLAGLAMSEQVLEVVVGEAVSVHLDLLDTGDGCESGCAQAESFVTLRARLHNRATQVYPLIVQLIAHSLHSSDPAQMEKQIAIAGPQHRLVPPIAHGAETHVDFDLCPLIRGIVELEVVVKAALGKEQVGQKWTSHQKLRLKVV